MNKSQKVKNKLEKMLGHKLKWTGCSFHDLVIDELDKRKILKRVNLYKCSNCNNIFYIGKNKENNRYTYGFAKYNYGTFDVNSAYCANIIIKEILE